VKITESYRLEQEMLHALTEYGTASAKYAGLVSEIVNRLGVTEVLDYGSGRGGLLAHVKFAHAVKMQCYDPAIPEFADDPIPMQMCAAIDVLEHIEPECLDAVLDDLQRCTGAVGLFTVCMRPAAKTLSDGRNAHLILQPMEWWLPKLWARFDIQTVQRMGDDDFYVIVYAKPQPIIEKAH
jgi:hypothetical protein